MSGSTSRRWSRDQPEYGQRQRDGVGERERRHGRDHAPQPAHAEQERHQEQQVIVATKNVADAQRQELPRRLTTGQRSLRDRPGVPDCASSSRSSTTLPSAARTVSSSRCPLASRFGTSERMLRRTPDARSNSSVTARPTRCAPCVARTHRERNAVERHDDRVAGKASSAPTAGCARITRGQRQRRPDPVRRNTERRAR